MAKQSRFIAYLAEVLSVRHGICYGHPAFIVETLHLLEHWPQAPSEFINVICSRFMLILLFRVNYWRLYLLFSYKTRNYLC